MSDRNNPDVRQIHPRTLALIGNENCLELIAIARDLRSGVIPPYMYNQKSAGLCNTACCILGHLRNRMGGWSPINGVLEAWYNSRKGRGDIGLKDLFSPNHPSDPELAADAIERFIFDGSLTPWSA